MAPQLHEYESVSEKGVCKGQLLQLLRANHCQVIDIQTCLSRLVLELTRGLFYISSFLFSYLELIRSYMKARLIITSEEKKKYSFFDIYFFHFLFKIYTQERSQKLRNWYNLIVQHEGELAELLTTEQGKPLFEAKGEVRYAASYVEWFAEEAKRIYGDIIPSPHPSRRLFSLKQPVGVAALWTPVTVKPLVIFTGCGNHC